MSRFESVAIWATTGAIASAAGVSTTVYIVCVMLGLAIAGVWEFFAKYIFQAKRGES